MASQPLSCHSSNLSQWRLPGSNMPFSGVQQLMKENQTALLRERRASDRIPFVRPVKIVHGRNHDEVREAFTRDFSPVGIGIVSDVEWPTAKIAELRIHSLMGKELVVKAEVRWCKPYGEGWFLVGWSFVG